MKNLRKEMAKKLIAVICTIALLQSYLTSFSYVVQALDTTANGEVIAGQTTDEVVIGEENEETEEVEAKETTDEVIAGQTTDEVAIEEEKEEVEQLDTNEEIQESSENNSENEENNEVIIGEEPEEYVDPSLELSVSSENTSIYKGYLYANATSNLDYATNYNTIDVLTIKGGKNMNSITVQDEADKMLLITGIKLALHDNMHYRQTRISVEEFNQILGENGEIVVYNPEGDVIGYINHDTEVSAGDYVFTYPYALNSVKFEIAGIQNDGTLSIKNDKAIKETSLFSRNQISLFSSINTMAEAYMYVPLSEAVNYKAEGNINLEETESKMVMEIDKDSLSTEDTNDMAISVTLKTDEERYDLFENPEISIEFPSAVEDVEITGVNLLYKNGLSLDNWDVTTNSNGREVLKVSLAGSQSEYTPGAVQEGTTVVIYTNVDVDRLTTDTSENLKLTYTNKDTIRKSYLLEGKESEEVLVGFVGRQEMLRSMTAIGSSSKNTSYDEDTEKIKIAANSETAQIVTINGSIVNNYEATVEDVVIVGRIPFVGNKDGNGNNMGTNFDSTLQTAVTTSGVIADVYYSEDGEAGKDDESWTQSTEDISKYRSYKIVVRDGSLAKGEKLTFEYHITIPPTVGFNAKGYATYTALYTLDEQNYSAVCSVGIVTDEKEITMDDISEDSKEKFAELTIGTQVSQAGVVLGEQDNVFERQIIKYAVVVNNTSNVTANNVKIKANADNGNLYVWDYITLENYWLGDNYVVRDLREFTKEEKEFEEITIDSLAPGESKIFEYQVVVNKDAETVQGNINVSADNITEKNVNTVTLNVQDAELEVRTGHAGTEDITESDTFTKGELRLYSYVKNITENKLNNVALVFELPEGLAFKESYLVTGAEGLDKTITKVGNETFVKFIIPELNPNEEREIYISTKINSIDVSQSQAIISVKAVGEIGENKYLSNLYQKRIMQSETTVDYSWSSNLDKETLDNGDEVVYTFMMKNTGNVSTRGLLIGTTIDSGLTIENIEMTKNGETIDVGNVKSILSESIILEPNEQLDLSIKCLVEEKNFKLDQENIEEKISVTGGGIEDFETDVISYKINNNYLSTNLGYEEENTYDPNDFEQFSEVKNSDQQNNTEIENNEPNNNDNQINEDPANVNDNQNQETNVQRETSSNVYNSGKTYTISGKVWLDKNKNGINDSGESRIDNILVYLYNSNVEGGLDTSNRVNQVLTNKNGEYVFTGVKEGNYVVVFNYDTTTYSVTKYQVKTAKSNENSDVVSKSITMYGVSSVLGLTDALTVSGSSLSNIDMGLVEKNEFDLKLEKQISEVTVKNKEGNQTYNYGNSKNAKLEIKSKNYKSSTLEITYKIIIKNEGEISGYVNKIIDYMPEETTIDFNNSPGWYQGQDGKLYYNGLVGKEIAAGESQEIKLTLKKSLANGEAVKVTNAAEIVEYTNARGLEDKDSIADNKVQSEDDYDQAILTVAISTGNTAQYIATILIIIIMLATIAMLAIKYKNTKKVYR